jgi:hypothetical protein
MIESRSIIYSHGTYYNLFRPYKFSSPISPNFHPKSPHKKKKSKKIQKNPKKYPPKPLNTKMFRAFTAAPLRSTTTLITQQKRFWHDLNTPRTWVQRYDKAIVEKYPRVLDVIQGKISKALLSTTERTALYVATYNTGVSGAKRIRQRERRANFMEKVDALVGSWRKVEILQRKATQRNTIIAKGTHNKLSTWKEKVNQPKFQMDFTLTSNKPSQTTVKQGPVPKL